MGSWTGLGCVGGTTLVTYLRVEKMVEVHRRDGLNSCSGIPFSRRSSIILDQQRLGLL